MLKDHHICLFCKLPSITVYILSAFAIFHNKLRELMTSIERYYPYNLIILVFRM